MAICSNNFHKYIKIALRRKSWQSGIEKNCWFKKKWWTVTGRRVFLFISCVMKIKWFCLMNFNRESLLAFLIRTCDVYANLITPRVFSNFVWLFILNQLREGNNNNKVKIRLTLAYYHLKATVTWHQKLHAFTAQTSKKLIERLIRFTNKIQSIQIQYSPKF